MKASRREPRIRINSVDTTALGMHRSILVHLLCADAYGVDVNSDNVINQFTNWTQELALAIAVTVESFDPNKAGTVLGFHLDYLPINNLVAGNATLLAPAVPVRLPLQSLTSNFATGTIMPLQTVLQILVCRDSSSVTLGNSAGVMDASVHTVQCERSCEQSMMMCTHRFAVSGARVSFTRTKLHAANPSGASTTQIRSIWHRALHLPRWIWTCCGAIPARILGHWACVSDLSANGQTSIMAVGPNQNLWSGVNI
ncbi:hypothetical protein B0H14DRAFT_1219533 [Mycena olivaceomarginata]|nr:hypothetical protein B0H14DRAFT_1219533 [Mycena olivaceomarginata]